MDLEGRRVLCKVCLTQYARYTCPRCNLAYCSLPCYKQHNGSCTEGFYRDQAVRELHGTRAEPQQKKDLLALLQRMQQLQADDEEMQQQLLQQLAAGEQGLAESGDESDSSDSDVQGAYQSLHQQRQGGLLNGPGDSKGIGWEDEEVDETDGEGQGEQELTSCNESDVEEPSESRSGTHETSSSTAAAGRSRAKKTPGAGLSQATLRRLLRKAEKLGLDNLQVDESDFTPDELARFHRALAAGQLSHLLPPWEPWWLSTEARELTLSNTGQRIVQETDSHGSGQGTAHQASNSQLPVGPSKPLQPLIALTKAAPSPLLRYQVLELVYAYCFILRRYNGDPAAADTLHEAVQTVLAISPALANSGVAAVASRNGNNIPHAPLQSPTSTPQPAGATKGAAGHSIATGAKAHTASRQASGSNHATGSSQIGASAGSGMAGRHQTPASSNASQAPASVAEALLNCIQAASMPPVGDLSSRPVAIAVLADMQAILEAGPHCLVLALSDLQALLMAASQQLQRAGTPPISQGHASSASPGSNGHGIQPNGSGASADGSRQGMAQRATAQDSSVEQVPRRHIGSSKRVLTGAVNKLWFFMCWVNEHRTDGLFEGQLAPAVQEEWTHHMQALQAAGQQAGSVQLPVRA